MKKKIHNSAIRINGKNSLSGAHFSVPLFHQKRLEDDWNITKDLQNLENKITMKGTRREAKGRHSDDQPSNALTGMDAICMVDFHGNGFSENRNSNY